MERIGRSSLLTVCRTFSDLQTRREYADYDDRYDVSRDDAVTVVLSAEIAIDALWNLQHARDPGAVILLRLGVGAIRVAKNR